MTDIDEAAALWKVALDSLKEFQDTLIAAAEMPPDLEPGQVTPWFVRLIVAAKKAPKNEGNLDAEDLAEFKKTLEEIARSPWSPDEVALAKTALEASEKRRHA